MEHGICLGDPWMACIFSKLDVILKNILYPFINLKKNTVAAIYLYSSMTYFTNYITDFSDSKVERGTRSRLPPSIDWFSLIPLLPSEKIGTSELSHLIPSYLSFPMLTIKIIVVKCFYMHAGLFPDE
uniref:Cytochrome b n=1 Tax=Heterorhabditis bacteriophora TaxID=37862 RepID=A0A1I7WSQ3_HETBA